ncbi:tyrosine-type recombinase/integrase [Salipaludibacillus sp. CF4.18]|uniref:tyrosine-type recombinase/integrase n=1 Tax=Salipaludibacillus sp. CF4.18 TaxID=3373081 RepID=UPI003EE5583F
MIQENSVGSNESIQVEDQITPNSLLSHALLWMKEYRYWSNTTFDSYYHDLKLFENYLETQQLKPVLKSGERLNIVNKWIILQKDNNVAYKTITRRIATLSSLYSFYKELGVVNKNVFKAVKVPGAHSDSHSRALDLDDLVLVFKALKDFKQQKLRIDVPIKLLLYTGLRNHALSHLCVKDIDWDDEVIVYNPVINNYKHKIQILPLPPKFLQILHNYVEELNLSDHDPLCYGFNGIPLKNKQLNLLVNKINKHLGWEGEKRVTPHGFRYTIATLLDEKDISIDTIKYHLGHTSSDNIKFYLKRDRRKIIQIKSALTEIETKVEGVLIDNDRENCSVHNTKAFPDNDAANLPFSEGFLIQLSQSNPELLEKIMLEHYKK